MNKEIQIISKTLQDTLEGEPWFGRSVYSLLDEVNPSIVYYKANDKSHSLADLLYHMITWGEFTQKRLEKDTNLDLAYFETQDWRTIDPEKHTWNKGLAEFKQIQQEISQLLNKGDDRLLDETVDYRTYNFRYLLNGYIQHNIYHAGQIAYLNKMLQK
jgi:uncharacterized damage-inducible protein DinB